jgi:hypothetical protein
MRRTRATEEERGSSAVVQGRANQADLLRRSLAWIIDEEMFTELSPHGNTNWKTVQFVLLAILWAWSDKSTLTGAFHEAVQLSVSLFGQSALASYPGFTSALVTWSSRLVPEIWHRLQTRMQQVGGEYWRSGGWLPLAVDGSRVSTPRSRSNEDAFSIKNYGRGKRARSRSKWRNKKRRSRPLSEAVKPQIWLTLIWHMGLKMPWCWKMGPSTSSEREHFLHLLKTEIFPDKTLFCGDAGFVGYELWKGILDRGHNFLIRVGGNVQLLRGLGHARWGAGVVFLWPNAVAKKKQGPVVLRLLEFQGARGRVYLVTNILSENALTGRQAKELYKLRWGVELQFRGLKQTFGRGKLRSRSAACALVELEWSLIGLWSIQLFAAKEQLAVESPPENSSLALALGVIQNAMRNWAGEVASPRELRLRLREAVKDNYHRTRSKEARYKPNYKDQPSPTKPVIVTASNQQKKNYQALALSA